MRIATTPASLLALAADAGGVIGTGTFVPPATRAIAPGEHKVLYTRSYSELFKPRNGPYTSDMLGRLYINVQGAGHYRSTRVVTSVTTAIKDGKREITAVSWSTNPADANSLAAGDVSKSLQKLGVLPKHPEQMTYDILDEDGNIESTAPQWERCENPDPLPDATSTTSALFNT